MTPAGIVMTRAAWTQLVAAIKTVLQASGQTDPMVLGLLSGIENSVPEICDLATVGLEAKSRSRVSSGVAYAVQIRSIADLADWLRANPREPFVAMPRPLAEAIAGLRESGADGTGGSEGWH